MNPRYESSLRGHATRPLLVSGIDLSPVKRSFKCPLSLSDFNCRPFLLSFIITQTSAVVLESRQKSLVSLGLTRQTKDSVRSITRCAGRGAFERASEKKCRENWRCASRHGYASG